jgi:hypothetical protein
MKRKEPDQSNELLNLNSDKNHKKNNSSNMENTQEKYMEFVVKHVKDLDDIGKRLLN